MFFKCRECSILEEQLLEHSSEKGYDEYINSNENNSFMYFNDVIGGIQND
ncbi:hypothetical protein MACH08_15800 [Oceanobacillus kimchii]|uniref:Uncharacterized protein n=1 Tax=Oceanobacillus kimchii TaxID=746691 RepID=A0ABQ5TFZ4_9BACI|nr:hypothetical protein MACH08_15800 [Oceanobacillus kimchii]